MNYNPYPNKQIWSQLRHLGARWLTAPFHEFPALFQLLSRVKNALMAKLEFSQNSTRITVYCFSRLKYFFCTTCHNKGCGHENISDDYIIVGHYGIHAVAS